MLLNLRRRGGLNMTSFASRSAIAPVTWSLRHQSNNSNTSSNQRTSPDIPLCEWNKIHESDVTKGYLLRATYQNSIVHFSYTPQSRLRSEIHQGKETPEPEDTPVPASALIDRNKRVMLVLPSPFVARLLGVLGGSMPSADIVTRSTTGTFTGDMSNYTFDLKCESTLQQGERLNWHVTLGAGEALLLQRFLTLALERNYGFTNYTEQPGDSRRRSGSK